nr:AAA family ATPase [Sorangium cellulosum]
MLTEAHFKNFKLLRDVRLSLGRLNVLVGPNAVGKSTVLEGLHDLLQLAAAKPGWSATVHSGVLFRGERAVEDLVAKPDATELELGAVLEDGRRFRLLARAATKEPQPEWGGPVVRQGRAGDEALSALRRPGERTELF